MYQVSFVHRLTKVLVDIMFFGGIFVYLTLPVLLPFYMRYLYLFPSRWNVPSIVLLIISGICGLFILYQLKKMLKSLIGNKPFVHQNVSCFRKCGVASFIISLMFFIRLFVGFTPGAAIIVVIFAMLGLFSLTMKDVFKQAVFYKEENDWTV